MKICHPSSDGFNKDPSPFYFSLLFTFYSLLFSTPEVFAMAKRPPVPPQAAVSMTPAKLSNLTLRESYELALKQSETVAIQKEDVEEAEAQFFIAASEAVGDIDFVMERNLTETQTGGDSSSVATSLTDPDRRTRKFVINQPLFQGFKAFGALTGAGSLKRQQKEEWLRARQLLFLDVVSAYYSLMREKKDSESIEDIHTLFRERVRELGERERIGRSRTSEVVTARSRMRILEAEASRARGTLALARHLLEFLTGMEWTGREPIDESLPEDSTQGLAEYLAAVESRPDVEAARQAVKTAWRGVIVAQSEFWPELSIEHTQYERREGVQANIDWDFLFKINVPLLQGGEAIGKFKQAVSKWKKEKLEFSKVRREAVRDIKDSYEKWLASRSESASLQEALKVAEENFRLQREEYAHNLVGNLDVLEALELLHTTRRDANRASYQMKEDYWRLRIAAGEVL